MDGLHSTKLSSPETRHGNTSEEEAHDKSDESEMDSKESPVVNEKTNAKKAKTLKNNRNEKAKTPYVPFTFNSSNCDKRFNTQSLSDQYAHFPHT